MSMRYQGGFLTVSYNGLKAPDAPSIGTATAGSASASVAFTAPSNIGGGAITGYKVTSSPGGLTATGTSSPITVTGLANFTAYTFTVTATNTYGTSIASAASNSVTPLPPLQVAYTTPGTYTFVAPANLSPATVSVVCVGGGGGGFWTGFGDPNYAGANGGGGGLGYINNYPVTAGNSYTVVVGAGAAMSTSATGATNGGDSYFVSTGTVKGGGGLGGTSNGYNTGFGAGGTYTGDGGGNGGRGGRSGEFNSANYFPGGGGGAGGYAGNGGAGADSSSPYASGNAGSGGGGGGASSGYGSIGGYGGGGVGILGQGSNGAAGGAPSGGGGGSGGTGGTGFVAPNYANGGAGGAYGGGGGGANPSTGNGGTHNGGVGGGGAVRIIYSFTGVTRTFPSTNTGDL